MIPYEIMCCIVQPKFDLALVVSERKGVNESQKGPTPKMNNFAFAHLETGPYYVIWYGGQASTQVSAQ